jgi:hypothetical protein
VAVAVAAVVGAVVPVSADVAVDLSLPGTHFNPGVRGQAVPAVNITRPSTWVGNPMAMDVSRGSSIRGVYGGLEADISDWRTRNYDARMTTLDYLRYSRDYSADLVITTNVRGLTAPDPSPTAAPGSRVFTDTSIATVTKMAAEWVRYTNRIAQSYHQGDVITDAKDKAVLDSLVWTSNVAPGDVHDLLPAVGERPVPKVTYWEIGNEPRVGLSNSYKVTNSYTFYPPARRSQTDPATHLFDYTERYTSMVTAMKAEDATIKVGPCLQTATAVTEKEILQNVLAAKTPSGAFVPVDFIGYHPYQKMGDETTPAAVTAFLGGIYDAQKVYTDRFRSLVTASGRSANSVELIASEVNVSNWPYNETPTEAQMAHALGSAETVFTFARLGVSAAHYWVFPSNQFDGTEYPVYKAYEGLRDHMGDELLSSVAQGDARIYTTRDSATGQVAIWGLNFSNDADAAVQLDLSGFIPEGYTAKLMTLGARSGRTTLYSGNLAGGMAGGPTNDVDWTTADLAGVDVSDYLMAVPAATIRVLVLDGVTVPEPGVVGVVWMGVGVMGGRRRR